MITSRQNPRVKQVVKLREHKHRRQTGLLIAEGQREITRALRAGLLPQAVYAVDPESIPWLQTLQSTLAGVPPRPVTPEVMEKMAYHQKPEGALAIFQQPAPPDADELPSADHQPLVLVAVGTEKPGNLGAMARTAEAAGAAALIAAGAPIDRFNPNAIRSSTGAVFSLPIYAYREEDALAALQAAGYRILAATPHAAETHHQTDLTGPAAIVIGPEDTGLSDAWLQAADARVTIPMATPDLSIVDSLNASVSAGILLFEAVRQRQALA